MSIEDIIRRKAQEYGVDPTLALAFAQIESGLNPNPTTGNGGGLYQLNKDWWKKYGNGQKITDAEANADAFMRYFKGDLAPGMQSQLGRPATPGELYLGHQQGVAGAGSLLADPKALAGEALASAYAGERNPAAAAAKALRSNMGDPSKTAGDFSAMWGGKLDAAARSFDPNWAGSNTAQIAQASEPQMAQPTMSAVPPDVVAATAIAAGQQRPKQKVDPQGMFSNLGQTGMGLLAAGNPPPQPQQFQRPVAHRPEMLGLLNPFAADPTKRSLWG